MTRNCTDDAHVLESGSREIAIRNNAGLVMSIARRFFASGAGAGRADLSDLFQAGCVGLIRAVDKYDPHRGAAFSTYAVPIIVSEIRTYLRGLGPIHIPRPQRELAVKCRRVQAELRGEFLREPLASEIASRLGIDASEVVLALEAEREPASLDAPASETHDSLCLTEIIPGDLAKDCEVCDAIALESAISCLSPVENAVIQMRFFEERTQAAVAFALGISQSQVHRIERNAIRALRRSMETE